MPGKSEIFGLQGILPRGEVTGRSPVSRERAVVPYGANQAVAQSSELGRLARDYILSPVGAAGVRVAQEIGLFPRTRKELARQIGRDLINWSREVEEVKRASRMARERPGIAFRLGQGVLGEDMGYLFGDLMRARQLDVGGKAPGPTDEERTIAAELFAAIKKGEINGNFEEWLADRLDQGAQKVVGEGGLAYVHFQERKRLKELAGRKKIEVLRTGSWYTILSTAFSGILDIQGMIHGNRLWIDTERKPAVVKLQKGKEPIIVATVDNLTMKANIPNVLEAGFIDKEELDVRPGFWAKTIKTIMTIGIGKNRKSKENELPAGGYLEIGSLGSEMRYRLSLMDARVAERLLDGAVTQVFRIQKIQDTLENAPEKKGLPPVAAVIETREQLRRNEIEVAKNVITQTFPRAAVVLEITHRLIANASGGQLGSSEGQSPNDKGPNESAPSADQTPTTNSVPAKPSSSPSRESGSPVRVVDSTAKRVSSKRGGEPSFREAVDFLNRGNFYRELLVEKYGPKQGEIIYRRAFRQAQVVIAGQNI